MTFHQQTSEMPPNNYWATCDKKNGGCLICVAKRQNGGRNSQKALHVPFLLQWGRFLQGGVKSLQVRTDLEADLKRTQNYCMEYVIGPISTLNDYPNTVFNDIVSLCRSCRNNALPQSLREKLLTCCNFLPACEKSFLTRKEYAYILEIAPSNRNIYIHLHSQKDFKYNIRQK